MRYDLVNFRLTSKDSWAKMHVDQATISMFMSTQEPEHIFVENKLASLRVSKENQESQD